VDDVIVLSPGPLTEKVPHCDTGVDLIVAQMNAAGFEVTELHRASEEKKIVGYQVEQETSVLRLPIEKMWNLAQALRWLSWGRLVDTELLRSLVGVWLWAALVARKWLSIPSAVFRFVDLYPLQRVRWWRSAREEVVMMAAVVPFFRMSLSRPVADWVVAMDAEGANDFDAGGFGVVMARASQHLVELTVLRDGRPGRTIAKLNGDLTRVRQRQKELKALVAMSFLPPELAGLTWLPLLRGRWKFRDHVMLGEGRATLKALEILAASVCFRGMIVPGLEDNESWAAAGTKGRSPVPQINFMLRRRAALLEASDVDMPLPWINTAAQPADALSRIH